MASYCEFAPLHPVHGSYHDKEYGFPTKDESVLFERLSLEIMQAGLSWETILKKRVEMAKAFDAFDVVKVARYGDRERKRLLANAGIIRNRLKIEAIIHNANVILSLRDTHGGFAAWLDAQGNLQKEAWVRLFKKTFKFTGGEIVGEFLMSIGLLPGAHLPTCPIYAKIEKIKRAHRHS